MDGMGRHCEKVCRTFLDGVWEAQKWTIGTKDTEIWFRDTLQQTIMPFLHFPWPFRSHHFALSNFQGVSIIPTRLHCYMVLDLLCPMFKKSFSWRVSGPGGVKNQRKTNRKFTAGTLKMDPWNWKRNNIGHEKTGIFEVPAVNFRESKTLFSTCSNKIQKVTRWWQLKYFLNFHPYLGKWFPFWLAHGWQKTTNQINIFEFKIHSKYFPIFSPGLGVFCPIYKSSSQWFPKFHLCQQIDASSWTDLFGLPGLHGWAVTSWPCFFCCT